MYKYNTNTTLMQRRQVQEKFEPNFILTNNE